MSITELGFAACAHFGSLGGTQTLFLPVPHAARVAVGALSFQNLGLAALLLVRSRMRSTP
ncbi:hypothetical protein [Burkholderia cenocepacia]|uniref:hypothetical protein n=1 Tax=Burkholderia cenocepacia TaxID=95486 RepID=UPI00222FAE29|nr:hypothetical protein [Burkholderia cenocepacia]MCW3610618.1 hypothetical protein [Burkholderia cenocepacia]MCW5191721.1 hypothetical protein [Burkholderia cenocepacia]